MKGYIRITDKVEFIYYKLKRPETINYFNESTYFHAWHKYRESKRQIKIHNVYHGVITRKWMLTGKKWNHLNIEIKDDSECEVKIIDNKAIIIKII